MRLNSIKKYIVFFYIMPGGKLTLQYKKEGVPKRDAKMRRYRSSYKSKAFVAREAIRNSYRQALNTMFPPIKYIKLVHESLTTLAVSGTTGNFGTDQTWYLNSIYQPRGAGSTVNRVQGYDQLENIYGGYKVYGCKVEATFSNPLEDGMYVGARVLSSGDVEPLAGERVTTAAMKKWTWIAAINDSGRQTLKYKRYWSIGKIEGLSKLQFDAAAQGLYTSDFVGNPGNKPVIQFAAASTVTTTTPTVQMRVKVTYYVQLNDRFVLATSVV